jgi:hypothetical protein
MHYDVSGGTPAGIGYSDIQLINDVWERALSGTNNAARQSLARKKSVRLSDLIEQIGAIQMVHKCLAKHER